MIWLFVASSWATGPCPSGIVNTNVAGNPTVPPMLQVVATHAYREPPRATARFLQDDVLLEEVEVEWFDSYLQLGVTRPLPAGPLAMELVGVDASGVEDGLYALTVDPAASGRELEAPYLERPVQRREAETPYGGLEYIETRWSEVDGATHYEVEVANDVRDFSGPHTAVAFGTRMLVGAGICEPTFPGYDPAERYALRVRAVGLEGQVSRWSEPLPAGRDALYAVGCATTGPFGPSLALAVLLGLLTRRR
ncbi:MAG: MYXO-CTERM sorting domain-containing protein [Myxococcota bacterium]